jgi:ketosteroid isomerase-like protein
MVRLGVAVFAAAAIAFGPLARYRTDAAHAAPPQESAEAAIRALHAELRRAAGRLDADALYASVLDTETPPIIEDGRVQPTRSDARRATLEGFRALTRISYAYTREHLTLLSPTTALWVGEGRATATLADGREVAGPFAETLVFVQRDGAWAVLHAHRSAPNRPR